MINFFRKVIPFTGILFFSLSVFSQRVSQVESEALVKKFKAAYPKEEVAAIESSESYTFEIEKSKSDVNVTAVEKGEEKYICLKSSASFTNVIFYDSASSVERFRCKSDKGTTEYIYTSTKGYEDDGIFSNDIKMFIYRVPFESQGAVKIVNYEKEHKDVRYLRSIYFHSFFPIKKKTITVEVPDWFSLELKEMNFAGFDIKKKETPNASRKTKTITYTMENLPASKNESMSPNRAFKMPHILLWSKNFSDKSTKHKIFETDTDLYKWYSGLVLQVDNKVAEFKPKVQQLIEGKKTDIEKVKTLFYWVQDNVRYIAFEDGIMGYRPESAANVFKNKYGDCKGKANLLCEMLKVAGFDARLCWIGTNDIPYDFSIPSLSINNHMICALVLNGKNYYLDGTEDYIGFDDYANRIQGRPVMVEGKDRKSFTIEKVPAFTYERNKREGHISVTLEGDILKGNIVEKITGEQKTQFLQGYNRLRSEHKEDALKSYLNNSDKNYVISNIVTSNLENRDTLMQIKYDFKLENYVTSVGKEVYVNVDPEKEFGEFDIDSTRISDIEFSHKIFKETVTEFTVPKGYKVDYLPEAVAKESADYIVNLNYQQKGNKIIYNKKIIFPTGLIPSSSFKNWNATQKEMRKFYKDQIVLIKG